MFYHRRFILFPVISMKSSKEMLYSILKTTQRDQIQIKSILACTMRPSLRKTLENQLQEYYTIESEAYTVAALRGWELPDCDPMQNLISNVRTRFKLSRGNPDKIIADMVIQRNTKEFINGLKNHENFGNVDLRISTLSQKLLDCETANILQMKRFL